MFNIIGNYKQLFTMCIKNNFGAETSSIPDDIPNTDKFGDGALTDLRKLQSFISDKKIDIGEAQELFDKADIIHEDVKIVLESITDSIVEKGFSVNNEKSYDSYKKLVEKHNKKLPEWSDLEDVLGENQNGPIFSEFFNGLRIEGNYVYIRYKSIGADTLKVAFDDVGLLRNTAEWISEEGDNEELKNVSKINNDLINKLVEDNQTDENQLEQQNKPEQQKQESEQNLKQKNNSEAINWNKSEFTEAGIALIQKSMGMNLPKGEYGIMGPKTLAKIQEKSSDGKVGLGVLKQIGLVDKDNNAISGLTKDMFKPGKLEKGNSGQINFNEVKDEQVTSNEEDNLKEPSVIDDTLDTIGTAYKESMEAIEVSLEEVQAWIKSILANSEDVQSFIGANGENIDIEYDMESNTLRVDTAFGDGVTDYNLGDLGEIKTYEQANIVVAEKIKEIKKAYDAKSLEADVGTENVDKSKYIDEEAVTMDGNDMSIDDLGMNTLIKDIPEGKQEELVKFYKQSGLSLIDFKSMFTEGHSYKDLRAENTFMSKPKVNENERVFADLNGENEYTVTLDRDTNTVNIDGGIMDIGGININKVPTMKELEKVVAWYNTSIRSKIDIPGNTMNYDDIKNDLYEL